MHTTHTPSTSTSAAQEPTALLTAKQLAARLGISRRSLTTWTRDKLLPMIKIGRICRFDYAKVRAVLDTYEQPAAPPASPTR